MTKRWLAFSVFILSILTAAGCSGDKGDASMAKSSAGQTQSSSQASSAAESAAAPASSAPGASGAVSAAPASSARPASSAQTSSVKQAPADDNCILDTAFNDGVIIFNPIKPPVTLSGRLDFGKNLEGKSSKWILTQWNSLNNIAKTKGKQTGTAYTYENEYKTVAVDKDGTVTLIMNASKDYLQPRKTPQDPWAHLYLEQRYDDQRNIGKHKLVNVTYDFMITSCVNKTPEADYNPNIHASIAVFYMTLGDNNPASPSYNEFINFCMPLFDDRVDIPGKSVFIDSGTDPNAVTNMLIYTMDGNLLYNAPTGNGKWHAVNMDIMPHIKDAFNSAKKMGCMKGTKFEDLALRSLFFGFENPGMIDTGMKIKNMSIKIK